MTENVCILIRISLKFVLKDLIDNMSCISSGNGLAPNRRQAITWTDDDPIHWRIYAALVGDELNKKYCVIWYATM